MSNRRTDREAFVAACDRLATRYPFFTDPDTGSSITPIIGPGWLGLLERTCEQLAAELGPKRLRTLRFRDVKSKHGGLRLYFTLATDDSKLDARIDEIVSEAEDEAERTCESCGAAGAQYSDGGWIVTACLAHARGTPVKATRTLRGAT